MQIVNKLAWNQHFFCTKNKLSFTFHFSMNFLKFPCIEFRGQKQPQTLSTESHGNEDSAVLK